MKKHFYFILSDLCAFSFLVMTSSKILTRSGETKPEVAHAYELAQANSS
jgi:hypothetical protein